MPGGVRNALLLCLVFSLVWSHAGDAQNDKKPALGRWGVETDNISPTVRPGDDF